MAKAKSFEPKTNLVFLGGNNKDRIGGNCIVLEHTNSDQKTARIMFDVGSVFTPYWSGFDEAFPDFRDYFDKKDSTDVLNKASKKIDALFFTHLHQDHIGALTHLINMGYVLPPVYASRNTRNFIRICARENMIDIPEINPLKSSDVFHINDSVEIEAFDVAHSAVDALGFHVLIKEGDEQLVGLINHGDFYTQEEMPVGKGFDLNAYQMIFKNKVVTHALIDATSVNKTKSERLSFDDAVNNVVSEALYYKDKQIVSPVISRSMQNIAIDVEAARRLGRKVCLDGKWLKNSYKAMQLSGYTDFEDVIYQGSFKEYLRTTPLEKRYIVNTGAFSQGLQEYNNNEGRGNNIAMASFTKMALGLHENFVIDKNTAIFARQRIIGEINGETGVELLNMAAALGAKIVCSPSPEVEGKFKTIAMQGSGHLNQVELKKLIEKGVTYIPIHGNAAQLEETAEIIKKLKGKSFYAENMDKLLLKSNKVTSLGQEAPMRWIAVEKQEPNPLDVHNAVPYQGQSAYYLVDENYEKLEELMVVENKAFRDEKSSQYKDNNAKLKKLEMIEANEDLPAKLSRKATKALANKEKYKKAQGNKRSQSKNNSFKSRGSR